MGYGRIQRTVFAVLVALNICCSYTLHARVALITDASQLSANQQSFEAGNSVANLIDGNPATSYHTLQEELTEDCWIEVRLNAPLVLGADEDIIVFTQRCGKHTSGSAEGHPTTFLVEGSADGINWEPFCHIYFLYRGIHTSEYSSRIRPKSGSAQYTHLRFTITANNARQHDSNGHRYMGMAEFQIYKIGRNEEYEPGFLVDRLHLASDYSYNYKDYTFVNTLGLLDPLNHKFDYFPLDAVDRRAKDLPEWLDWGSWQDGVWSKDKEILESKGISLPKFSLLTSVEDNYIGPGQKRQPTHVTEHVLYAVPGDAIALYPYYAMSLTGNYKENFSHWYDYTTGGRIIHETRDGDGNPVENVDLLDFLINPEGINKTDNIGFLGGSWVTRSDESGYIEISDVEQYLDFERRVNGGETDLKVRLTADLDFSGKTVSMVGTESNPYRGVFDGQGHKISNLKIENGGVDVVGMFAWVAGGCVICNLELDPSCYIYGNNYTGMVGVSKEDGLAGNVWLRGLRMSGEIRVNWMNAGGILGANWAADKIHLHISDCLVDGIIKGQVESAAISGFVGNHATVANSYSCVKELTGVEGEYSFCRDGKEYGKVELDNCYDTNRGNGLPAPPADMNGSDFIAILGKGWQAGDDHAVPSGTASTVRAGDRYWGTVGTFFYPRDPYAEDGVMQSLPQEYVIAADFSQSFSLGNIDDVSKTIYEPVIHFRHIFKIRDGKSFAEEFSGSPEKNQEYIRKNMRHVSARAGVPFQIRFDSPVPASGTTRSKYYYKISDSDYRRVCTMRIRVLDAATRQVLDNNVIGFYAGESFDGQGSRWIDGVEYQICGGGGKYYRMLKCDRPVEGRYLVQILGNDINGNPIKIIGSNEDLVVMEMQVTFLPETAASMVTEAELYADDNKYKHARDTELESNYGAPKSKVDFDEYVALESPESVANPADYLKGSGMKYMYRLPVAWDKSTYTFGYDTRFDYGMYMIASHSELTPYKDAASKFNDNYGEGSGLYDRLFYKTRREGTTPRRGYFYYVNAAEDPGVMARLNIDHLCLGSTIHVSAWVAEFSADRETANLTFNFVAVLKNSGDRVPLHSFVSGYVDRPRNEDDDFYGEAWPPEGTKDKRGQWMNIYYSFVPNYSETGITTDMIDHYELELDNNCRNSGGADYAIDNIRVYIAQPMVYGTQLTPVCDKDIKSTRVKIESPFDVLLQTIGEIEAPDKDSSKTVNLYYTIIDKRKFDSKYAEYAEDGDMNPGMKAYEDAVLRYQYRGQGDDDQTFGKISFSTHFASNPDYDEDQVKEVASKETGDDGDRIIAFNTVPNDDTLSSGKEYYISIYTPVDEIAEVTSPGWTEFDINNECAKMCVFRVKPSSVIKIDGELRSDLDNITCCENQSPVVQVNIYGIKDGELTEIEKNAYLDWFDGTNSEYMAQKKGDLSLDKAIAMFRNSYPDSETANVDSVPDLGFTKEMRDYVLEMSTNIPKGKKAPLLTLYKSSYVFDPVKLTPGEEYKDCYVLALPITAAEGNTLICAQPTEVKMRVRNKAPELYHGLRGGITYPEAISDVPLRIGLAQLKKVSASSHIELKDHSDKLNIPVRKVDATSKEVTSLRMMTEGADRLLYLVETNDPQYKDLGTLEDSGEEIGALMAVGELVGLTANISSEAAGNAFNAVFYDDFRFKEGYYYRMRFMFEENVSAGEDSDKDADPDNDENESKPVVCEGQDVFTVKVVPAYQKWTGAASETNRNWNNDNNWCRVNYDDLLIKSESRKVDMAEYVTDGVGQGRNDRNFSYAPLDFTKVIIPDGEKFPETFSSVATDLTSFYSGIINPDGSNSVLWTENPSVATDGSSPAGEATDMIQFDMAAYSATATGIDCRPWYANTCSEIHFMPRSELLGQGNLIYGKAWVDVENKPGRWYTLGLPLKSVYAGDMYLPSDNARQETELFNDISYSGDINNRFSPAVFQRGWNKSKATVYEIKDGPSRNVAVKANWSHVYNDVTEAYGLGTGFSIKTDVSAMGNHDGKNVIFRLPKSDTYFDYYSHDGSQVGNRTDIPRDLTSHFRLNDAAGTISAVSRGDNSYFLVGNPFMSHLDMELFLKANEDKVSPKYWILTEDSQKMAVFDEASGGFIGSASGVVAPLQGFFVEALDNAAVSLGDGDIALSLKYDETMSCLSPFAESPLRESTRAVDTVTTCLSVAAMRDGVEISRAFLNVSSSAKAGYDANEDAVMIDNSDLGIPVSVYTIGDNKALSVNSTDSLDGTEIGLIASDEETTTLLFEGTAVADGFKLYDSLTGEYADIHEGMEYAVSGAISGRLYLMKESMEEEIADGIRILVKGQYVTVFTGLEGDLSINVHDMLGAKILSEHNCGNEFTFTLDKGVYVLDAIDGVNRIAKKIMIRK